MSFIYFLLVTHNRINISEITGHVLGNFNDVTAAALAPTGQMAANFPSTTQL